MQVISNTGNALAVHAMRADMLQLLQENAGEHFQLAALQKRYDALYGSGPASVRDTALLLLTAGRIRQATGVTPAAYYAPSAQQLREEQAWANEYRPFRPLKRGIGMYENINRAKAARDCAPSIG